MLIVLIPKKLNKELKLLIPDPINLNSWLNSKNSNLDNKTPLELINENNLKPLWNMIEQINANTAN